MFKVGDRVRFWKNISSLQLSYGEKNLPGKTGTVIDIAGYFIGVQFDYPIEKGHDCNGLGENGKCRYVFEQKLEPITKQ